MDTLSEMLIDQLQMLVAVQHQRIDWLERQHPWKTGDQLSSFLQEFEYQSKQDLERVQDLLSAFGHPPGSYKGQGIKPLLDEGRSVVERYEGDKVKAAATVITLQKIDCWDLTCYQTVILLARASGHSDLANRCQWISDGKTHLHAKLAYVLERAVTDLGSSQPSERTR